MATKNVANLSKIGSRALRSIARARAPRSPRTVKCIPYPNRSRERLYTAKDLGRIACIVRTRTGTPLVEMLAELKRCAPCVEEFEGDRRAISAAVAAIAANAQVEDAQSQFQRFVDFLRANQAFLLGVAAALAALLVLVRGGAALLPIIGAAAVRVAVTRITAAQAQVVAQQAANSATFQILRQSAANNPLFRRVVGL